MQHPKVLDKCHATWMRASTAQVRRARSRFVAAGLDSASTSTIVQSLANMAHATDATIIIALLQPEPQVYDLFDDVLLLANGRIAYHGPQMAVKPYFSSLGFECTGRKAVADFLQVCSAGLWARLVLCNPEFHGKSISMAVT
jgi:energy-coupling factor transporter ATP-binding protein EcfA2